MLFFWESADYFFRFRGPWHEKEKHCARALKVTYKFIKNNKKN